MVAPQHQVLHKESSFLSVKFWPQEPQPSFPLKGQATGVQEEMIRALTPQRFPKAPVPQKQHMAGKCVHSPSHLDSSPDPKAGASLVH